MDIHDTSLPASLLPVPDAPRYRLPITAYVWFALLCVGAAWARVSDVLPTGTALIRQASGAASANVKKSDKTRQAAGSAQEFSDLVQAERLTRTALAAPYLSRSLMGVARGTGRPLGAPAPSRPDDPRRSARKPFDDAIRETRALATRTGSMNFARRAIVLEHAAGRRLDENYLSGQLTTNLRRRGKNTAEIERELTFWRSLYGSGKVASTPSLTGTGNGLLSGMELGLLEQKVRADMRRAAGDAAGADRLDDAVGATAARSLAIAGAAGGAILLAFFVDFCLLIGFIVFAASRQLKTFRPVTAPVLSPVLRGVLADCFTFYFALLFVSRPVFGLIARQFLPGGAGSAPPSAALGLTALGYLLVHGIAAIYTVAMLRRSGMGLDSIGLNGQDLLRNVGWGVLGYCVALPLVALLGQIASVIFRDNPNVTPNPALPLLASADGLGPRLIIFALVAVAAPLFEEFFFRGVLYTALRARWSIAASIAVSAVLFAIGHPLQDWLPIFGLGLVFAALREWRQSIVPGIIAHFLQNGLTFLMLSALFSR